MRSDMSNKPDEKTLIAYLYNELDEQERAAVEDYLHAHPDGMKAIEELMSARKMLSLMEDKEVISPPLVIGSGTRVKFWNLPYLRTTMGIAASLIILLLVGKALDLQARYEDNGLTISFGPVEPAREVLTRQDIKGMINTSIGETDAVTREELSRAHDALSESIRRNLTNDNGQVNKRIENLVSDAAAASRDQIRMYVAGLGEQNRESMRDYMQLTTAEQKEYLESLLVDFAKYLQQQRNEDIRMLQMKLSDIEEDNTVFKRETEEILSGIISAVSNPDNSTNN